ncbi:hypothetical protein HCJ76_44210 [Streptomyces sp. MC1]|uniref:hypothetical protein n=1 Tax=Streptomyces sp. MC1 TaxID=295105 RepID=UPI0018C91C11|nr:hypothetical protein [Streptomyces sp. MC1]MBG7704889.1 hypothetical protein [Streptomyces sp. MC1]
MEGQSIAAWRTQKVQAYSAAHYNGDTETAARIAEELRLAHVALGHRETGTREEQNTYLLARASRMPLPELAAVGINSNDWPPPPAAPAPVQPQKASPATERHISSLFEAAGPLSDRQEPSARYRHAHRPEDNKRFQGRALEWALVDTETGLPVAYFEEEEDAEYQADQASDLYASVYGRKRR